MAKKLIEMQSIVQKRKKNTVSGKRKEETILGHDIWRKIKPPSSATRNFGGLR